jgi:methionyl-tRNA formyltransferase
LKVLFFGYSQAGYRAVRLLAERGDEVLAVVTHRDDPHENRWYRTPAEAAAEGPHPPGPPLPPPHSPTPGEGGITSGTASEDSWAPVVYSEDLGPGGVEELAERLAPDLILSVFYRDLLPGRVLAAARLAALNLHPSLLPAYRGRAPINWVLVNGERETGVTLHHMTARADAGDIVAQQAVPIAPRDTAFTLYHKVEHAAVEILTASLPLVAEGKAPRMPQNLRRSSYFGRRRPEDGRIDWTWPAARIDALVRAVAPPWPGAFSELEGRRIVVAAGEPAVSFPLAGDKPQPGTVRRSHHGLLVAAGDRWFRIDSIL